MPGSYFSRSILRCFKPPRSYHYFLIPPSSSCFLPKPDLSGHCRISTASSKLQISVGTAGPERRAPELSGHCRTSTARARSQWALRDLNCDNCECKRKMSHMECQIECQKRCQRKCQVECQNILYTFTNQNRKKQRVQVNTRGFH